jgi:homoserine O-acetyltransferase
MTEFIPPGTRFHSLPSTFPMKRGGDAAWRARCAYETWGTLNCRARQRRS